MWYQKSKDVIEPTYYKDVIPAVLKPVETTRSKDCGNDGQQEVP
jgi:hypothetical protein